MYVCVYVCIYITDVPFLSGPIRSEPVLLRFIPVSFVPILRRSAGQAGLDVGTAFRQARNCSVPFRSIPHLVGPTPVWSVLVQSCPALSSLNQISYVELVHCTPNSSRSRRFGPIWSGLVRSSPVWSGPVQPGLFQSGPVRSGPIQRCCCSA